MSSRKACIELLGNQYHADSLPKDVPKDFRALRPWVHHGWEMVLVAAEMLRSNSPLVTQGAQFFSENYQLISKEALKAWDWSPIQLQSSLENVRQTAINLDRQNWLALHKPFSHVIEYLHQLKGTSNEWAVLTTKSTNFTAELLSNLQLKPSLLYGREAGDKASVLRQLTKNWLITGFVEDRRATLETIINTPDLSSIPCYLASWGYLKENDRNALTKGIHLLEPETMAAPLASWS